MDGSGVDVVVGALVAAVIGLVVLGSILRRWSINRGRRARGAPTLTGGQIRDVERAGGTPRAATEAEVAEAAEYARQVEWERSEYGRELARYGRAQTRFWCERHQRHCKGSQRAHPPGGDAFEAAPPGWTPTGAGPPMQGA